MEEVLIRFRLVGEEARALCELSCKEMREPRDQTRFLVQQELKRRGLLQDSSDVQTEKEDDHDGTL